MREKKIDEALKAEKEHVKEEEEKEKEEKKEDFVLYIRTTKEKMSDLVKSLANNHGYRNTDIMELKVFKRTARYGRDWFY